MGGFRSIRTFALALDVLVLSAGGAALLTQCSGSSTSSNASDASLPCPAAEPSLGSPCSLPSSTQCDSYPTAANACPMVYVCNGGIWSGFGNGGLAPECPSAMPRPGSPCVSAICSNVDFECPFACASGQTVTALCEHDTWQIVPCGAEAGIVDSGIGDADVVDADASDSGA